MNPPNQPIICAECTVTKPRKRCVFAGCTVQPSFNLAGQSNGLYCADHKLEGMVNVTSKRCVFTGCMVQPHFNLVGQFKALYCANHKLEGMVDVVNKRCVFAGCMVIPSLDRKSTRLNSSH